MSSFWKRKAELKKALRAARVAEKGGPLEEDKRNIHLERKERYSIEEVLGRVLTHSQAKFDDDLIDMTSQRYHLFRLKGVTCVKCGLQGRYFVKERHKSQNGRYHFNLYAVDSVGDETLMTKDHIIPRSKGGRDHIDNYQVMCIICNMIKQDEVEPDAITENGR